MSIQLVVCSPRELLDFGERQQPSERKQSLERFVETLKREVKSLAIDLDGRDFGDEKFIFDFGSKELLLADDATREYCQDHADAMWYAICVPCSDAEEHFFFQFDFTCAGENITWNVRDINSVKEWIAALREAKVDPARYDVELLQDCLEQYDLAVNTALHNRGLLFFSY